MSYADNKYQETQADRQTDTQTDIPKTSPLFFVKVKKGTSVGETKGGGRRGMGSTFLYRILDTVDKPTDPIATALKRLWNYLYYFFTHARYINVRIEKDHIM